MHYKVYKEEGKYVIYDVYGKKVAICSNEKAKNQVLQLLENDFTPANDNSILNTPIAKATREILGKEK